MIMIFNNQTRFCHPERSEGSVSMDTEMLRSAQHDTTLPLFIYNNHHPRIAIPALSTFASNGYPLLPICIPLAPAAVLPRDCSSCGIGAAVHTDAGCWLVDIQMAAVR